MMHSSHGRRVTATPPNRVKHDYSGMVDQRNQTHAVAACARAARPAAPSCSCAVLLLAQPR
eukprot:1436994-Prymnesium_polylepis.1